MQFQIVAYAMQTQGIASFYIYMITTNVMAVHYANI